ncbi:hypothetical protein Leryth_010823 [Lithospermum erythrorhizon]|nr:hypothetical protein Leryth_010823 [Lithospermum erythrorhizon]
MAMVEKPWKAEYAKSSRSSCKICKQTILKENLRIGKMFQATNFDGVMTSWHHASCIFRKPKQIKADIDVDGLELLRWEDQQRLRDYIGAGNDSKGDQGSSSTIHVDAAECKIEVSPNARATCRICSGKILKGEVRISITQGRKASSWHHAKCLMESSPTIQMEKLSGWESLSAADQTTALNIINKDPLTSEGAKLEKKEGNETFEESNLKGNGKRRKAVGTDGNLKLPKAEVCDTNHVDKQSVAREQEKQLEAQTKALWDLKDDLKKYVTTAELRDMLETNDQELKGSDLDLRDRCADGMLFGALDRCPDCSANLYYSRGMYRCDGYISEWSKCSYSSIEPGRLKRKWKVPDETRNEFLIKWHKSQKLNKPARLMPASSSTAPSLFESANTHSQSATTESRRKRRGSKRESGDVMTVKVKGRSAVHESSGLQDSGHILEHGKSVYNTTLSLSDLSTGVNSYYILQIIEEDNGCNCHLLRKWGRVGNEKIGGKKLDERSQSDAIEEFKRLFLEKTGNPWEAWEQKEKFRKQPGKFYPLDIDYGVDKNMPKKTRLDDANSELARPVRELIKMLFNIETYRAAMMEFEINMSEMPLGKLSKSNIQKGFEALTEIQNILESKIGTTANKNKLIDASNRFFTVIPSIHPHVIKDEADFKSKVKMLEALQDIEIASRLVGFDGDGGDTLDEKYKKLRCNIHPLHHESEEFLLINKYLHTTHAPTHTGFSLELEEVFSLDREGEYDKFAPYRQKLNNRMLLWHGSRLTNFVGILSQGLRVAPPEAPATGYMFGKGIYFADMVSKSAQYCFTNKTNPVGLMLLSEVALGQMQEFTKAKYVDQPPKGKHSTKGLGRIEPSQSEFVKWKDDVVVPCGRSVKSKFQSSDLSYNEYIVYNTAQVKMQFLLKVRFHHK